jgi:recombination protein RecA
MSLIYGYEGSCKTTLAMKCAAAAQRESGSSVLWIDADSSFTTTWFSQQGGDPTQAVVHRPKTAEEAIEASVDLLDSAPIDCVVVDNLASLTPAAELERPGELGPAWEQAAVVNRLVRTLSAYSGRVTSVLLNQVRDSFSQTGALARPGGRAQDFASALMVQTWTGPITKDDLGNSISRLFHLAVAKDLFGRNAGGHAQFVMRLADGVVEEDSCL